MSDNEININLTVTGGQGFLYVVDLEAGTVESTGSFETIQGNSGDDLVIIAYPEGGDLAVSLNVDGVVTNVSPDGNVYYPYAPTADTTITATFTPLP